MTRKNFVLVAASIAAMENVKERQAQFHVMSAMFASLNPRFDKEKFRKACGL
jgi:hypothetical protein